MRRKIAVVIPGVVFTLFVAYHLVICFISGIAPLPENEIRGYIIKSVLMALFLPAVIYSYTVYSFYLIKENEKLAVENRRQANEYNKSIIEHKRQIQSLRTQYNMLLKKYENVVAELNKMMYQKWLSGRAEDRKNTNQPVSVPEEAVSEKAENVPKTGDAAVPFLVSAYTAKKKFSDEAKRELYEYLEEL